MFYNFLKEDFILVEVRRLSFAYAHDILLSYNVAYAPLSLNATPNSIRTSHRPYATKILMAGWP